jgi:hypothetical protein
LGVSLSTILRLINYHSIDGKSSHQLILMIVTEASAKKFEKLSRETNIDVKNLLASASLIGYDSTNSFLQPQSLPFLPQLWIHL